MCSNEYTRHYISNKCFSSSAQRQHGICFLLLLFFFLRLFRRFFSAIINCSTVRVSSFLSLEVLLVSGEEQLFIRQDTYSTSEKSIWCNLPHFFHRFLIFAAADIDLKSPVSSLRSTRGTITFNMDRFRLQRLWNLFRAQIQSPQRDPSMPIPSCSIL